MNYMLIAAGIITILVGLVHSILGERLIFSSMRKHTLAPTYGGTLLRERYVRILWATWHLVSLFGVGFAIILFQAAIPTNQQINSNISLHTIAFIMLSGSALVCYATKAKHPGWAGLLSVALLILFA